MMLLTVVPALSGGGGAWAASASGARLGLHGDNVTRFVMDLSESVHFKVSTKADPYRVVIDSPGLEAAGNSVPKPWGAVNGLRGEDGRLTLDLRKPATVKGAFIIPPRDGMGWRLVVDLAETSREAFLASVDASPAPTAQPAPAPRRIAAASPPPQPVAPQPVAPQPIAKPAPLPSAPPIPAPPVAEPTATGNRIVVTSPNATAAPPLPPPVPVERPSLAERPNLAERPANAATRPAKGLPMLSAPMPPPPERPAPPAPLPVSPPAPPQAEAAPAPALASTPTPPPTQVALHSPAPAKLDGVTKARDGVPVIVIDPGHGGVDPGAIGVSGIYEKHITLAMARELKTALEKGGRYRVHLTRDRDVFIRLRDRVAIARQVGADLFISLHADAVQSPQIRGLSVYTLSQNASDSEAQALAEKENKADLIAGVDLSHETPDVAGILIDLAQRETMNRSAGFATELVDEVGQEMDLLGNTHRFAGFAVLKAPDVPAVLVEMGYLSNEFEERQLRQPQYRARLAKAVTRAIERYFPASLKAKRP
ncbi:N-acetylmuramoyl-L-alanine amidase [Magnetospirillum sp. SS-4]|uniref:N-acetylmuramoyl-L-alanine amidase n=1 Tax=Magnetospirillum sp. SS-4 TaxID=2681465 RepID=UPI0020C4660E|nr:N-acetylmuramoyl-L-alanine amidase [Magnetospirillum sp. SS-4]